MALYRYSLSGRVHRGSIGGMSEYLARGDFGRDAIAASDYLAQHKDKEPALWGGLYAPERADARFRGLENAEAAWSEAARAERQRNGQVAEHFIIALPKELTVEQNRWALQDHIREFTRAGRMVQAAIHADERGGDNLHAHLLVSTRRLEEHGFERLKSHDQQSRFMHREEYLHGLREDWAKVANRHLERHGREERVDHRSLKAQGIDREPERHMGAWAAAQEREGRHTRVGDHNRAVRERNAALQRAALDRSEKIVHEGLALNERIKGKEQHLGQYQAAIEQRRETLSHSWMGWREKLHDRGWWRDQELSRYETGAERVRNERDELRDERDEKRNEYREAQREVRAYQHAQHQERLRELERQPERQRGRTLGLER